MPNHNYTEFEINKRKGDLYEAYIGQMYKSFGFEVFHIGLLFGTDDHGIDIIAKKGAYLEIVQCKWRESSFLSPEDVNKILKRFRTFKKTFDLSNFNVRFKIFTTSGTEERYLLGIPPEYKKDIYPLEFVIRPISLSKLENIKIPKVGSVSGSFEYIHRILLKPKETKNIEKANVVEKQSKTKQVIIIKPVSKKLSRIPSSNVPVENQPTGTKQVIAQPIIIQPVVMQPTPIEETAKLAISNTLSKESSESILVNKEPEINKSKENEVNDISSRTSEEIISLPRKEKKKTFSILSILLVLILVLVIVFYGPNMYRSFFKAPTGKVYIAPYSGERYHFYKNCEGLKKARSIEIISFEEALHQGLKICGYCDNT